MTEQTKRIKPVSVGLLVFAVACLTNPVVNIFDYLPDLIGYLIIVKALGYFADRVPYFSEARDGFTKLLIVSALKIPSYFIMIYARGQNTMDYDVRVLFTFTFAVVEVFLFYFAIRNLFRALSYLGERSEAAATISPFPISKKGTKKFSPDGLEIMSLVFVIYKAVATAIPEMLLLTRGVSASNIGKVFNVAKLYPYAIMFAVVSVFVFGVILAKRWASYIRAMRTEGKAYQAADNMLDADNKARLEINLKVRDMRAALAVFIVGAFFMIDVCFDNFQEINLLPMFLFGAVSAYGIWRLGRHTEGTRTPLIVSIAYTAVSLVTFILQVIFLEKFGYTELLYSSGGAKEAYLPVIISAGVEFLMLCAMFVFMAKVILSFGATHTGIDVHDQRYSRMDAENQKIFKRKTYIFVALGIVSGASKLAEIIFRYFPKKTFVSVEGEFGVVVSGMVPWFSVVVMFTAVAYICYSIHIFGKLRDEVELKYS